MPHPAELPDRSEKVPFPGEGGVPATGGGDATLTRLPGSGSAATPPPAPPEQTVPQQVGRFTIRRFLGEGVFGRVYEAYDQSLRREVALKVAKPEQLANPGRVRRFEGEARAAAGLMHPNIVGVYDHGQDGPHHYIAMTFIRGRSLESLLEEQPAGRALPLEQAAGIVRKLAEALAYAHRHEVIHRDVKPANVLIDEQGEPLLADFGLAARADEEHRETRGGALGTPAFTAPEQWQGKAGPGSDQYSLGCLLFELLTGQTPFAGGNDGHYMFLHLNEPPPSPRRLRAEVPRDLETVCLKCLQKEPARRYADCQALADDLRRWLEGEPIAARRVGRIESVVKWMRRQPVVAGLLAAVVVAVAVGTTVSVAFAIQARQQEKEAAEKEKDAREALAAVEENLAVGLLRPLGHFKNESALNDFELDALEELASLPREHDRVRRLFLIRALDRPGTAGQLSRRLEEAVIAAVGLRQDLRREVMREAARCLADADTSREAKVVCARLLAQLCCEEPDEVVLAADFLVEEMARKTDDDSDILYEALTRLARKVPAKHAAGLVGRIVELDAKMTYRHPLHKPLQQVQYSTKGLRDPLDQAVVEEIQFPTKELPPEYRVLAFLANKVPAGEAATLADRIVDVAAKTGKPMRLLSEAFAPLASKMESQQVGLLADRLVRVASKTSNSRDLATLSSAFIALASKLPAEQADKQAASLAQRVVEVAAETNESHQLQTLSGAFAPLASKMESQQAGLLADRLVRVASKTSNSHDLATLSSAFIALASKLPAEQADKQAASLAQRVVEVAAGTHEPQTQATLSSAVTTLAGKLPAAQAGMLANRLVELASNTRDSYFLGTLSIAFTALAGKLPTEQANKQAATLANRIVDVVLASKSPGSLKSQPMAFAALASMLSAAEATNLARRVIEVTSKTTDPHDLQVIYPAITALARTIPTEQVGTLVDQIADLAAKTINSKFLPTLSCSISNLAGKLSPEQASTLAGRIVVVATKTTDLHDLATLSSAFIALASKLPAEQADKQAASLAQRVVEVAAETNEYKAGSLSPVLSSLVSKLSAEQAGMLAGRMVELASKATHSLNLDTLLVAFTALAGKRTAEQANKQAATLADRIVDFVLATNSSASLHCQPSTFAALANKLPAGQAAVLAHRIDVRTAEATEPDFLATLSKIFVALPGKRKESQETAILLRLARMSHRVRTAESGLGSLDRLLPQVRIPILLEALKQPGCVGTTRAALLAHLGQRNNRSFADVWELVDYLKEKKPDLDLISPLSSARGVPRAELREDPKNLISTR